MNTATTNAPKQRTSFSKQAVIINHNIPTQKYFAIAQPLSVSCPTVDSFEPNYVKPILLLKDKTGQEHKAEVNGHWTFTIDQLLNNPGFCLLTYGLPAAKLAKTLCLRYPEIERTQEVRFILLKKL